MSEGLNNFFSFRFHIKLSYTSNDGKAGSSEAGVFITVPRGALNKRPSWASVPSPSGQGCPSTVQKVMGREAWASLCSNREAQPWMRTAGGGGGGGTVASHLGPILPRPPHLSVLWFHKFSLSILCVPVSSKHWGHGIDMTVAFKVSIQGVWGWEMQTLTFRKNKQSFSCGSAWYEPN